MPELPEVETVASKLRQIVTGKKFANLKVNHSKSFSGHRDSLVGREVTDVSRRAKYIAFHLDNDLVLLTHLKMTGQLIYLGDDGRAGGGHPTADWVQALPSKHTRIEYQFTDGSNLFFNDQRIFGWMRLHTPEETEQIFAKLGPDINDPNLDSDFLHEKLKRRTIPIKQAIMTNQIVCGLGNIYAADALNKARISPFRSANSLSKEEVALLLEVSQKIINRAIDLGGTTFDGKYVGVDGMAGGYQDEALTYGREGESCYNCGSLIQKQKLAGRGTYYCPSCQK